MVKIRGKQPSSNCSVYGDPVSAAPTLVVNGGKRGASASRSIGKPTGWFVTLALLGTFCTLGSRLSFTVSNPVFEEVDNLANLVNYGAIKNENDSDGSGHVMMNRSQAGGQLSLRDGGKKESPDAPHHLFGFFYQVHKQPKATLKLVQSVHDHMPNAPIHMVSSGGYHYDPLAKRFPQIGFHYDDHNVNLPKASGNLTVWFDRVYAAATWCNCTYLVILEDDVQLREPLQSPPQHDAGGVAAHMWTSKWTKNLLDRFAKNWTYESSGMCGGSYVRAAAYLEAYSKIDWNRIQKMQQLVPSIGKYNDITLGVVIMDAGFTLKPWRDLTEIGNKFHNASASIAHQYKRYYNLPLNAEDGLVVTETNLSYFDNRHQIRRWKYQAR